MHMYAGCSSQPPHHHPANEIALKKGVNCFFYFYAAVREDRMPGGRNTGLSYKVIGNIYIFEGTKMAFFVGHVWVIWNYRRVTVSSSLLVFHTKT